MKNYNSILDPKNTLYVNEKDWVVSLMRSPDNAKDPNHAFILVEGINQFDKRFLIKYESMSDIFKENTFIVKTDSRVGDDNNIKEILSDLLEGKTVKAKAWQIRKEDAEDLQKKILMSQQSPGNYNELGDKAIFPKFVSWCKALSPEKKAAYTATFDTLSVAATGIASGPQFASSGLAALGIYHAMPKEVKESMSGACADLVEATSGYKARKFLDSNSKPIGDNSFTWARNMLYSLNNKEIIKSLPMKVSDLVISLSSHHIDDKKESKIKKSLHK